MAAFTLNALAPVCEYHIMQSIGRLALQIASLFGYQNDTYGIQLYDIVGRSVMILH